MNLQSIKESIYSTDKEIYKNPAFEAELIHAGREVKPALIDWNGKEQVLITTPMSNERSALIPIQNKEFEKGKEGITGTLSFMVGHEKASYGSYLLTQTLIIEKDQEMVKSLLTGKRTLL